MTRPPEADTLKVEDRPLTFGEFHKTIQPMAEESHKNHVALNGDGNGNPGLKSDFRVMSARFDFMCRFMWMSLSATLITLTGATVTLIIKALS